MQARHTPWIALLFALFACASSNLVREEAWYEGDTLRGTLIRTEVPEGFEYTYVDLENRLMRLELRNEAGELRGGACIRTFQYDELDRPARIANHAADMSLTIGVDGYAVELIRYGADEVGREASQHVFFDPGGRPMTASGGFAQKRIIWVDQRPMHLRFMGLDGNPVTVIYQDVPGTAEVEFAYLQGVTGITFAILRNAQGQVIEKKRIAGIVYRKQSVTTTSYPTYNADLGMVIHSYPERRTELVEH